MSITREQIAQRATDLQEWNSGNGNPRAGKPFSFWLNQAETEAREGRTEFWHFLNPESREDELKRKIDDLYRAPFGMRVTHQIAALQAELRQLAA